MRRRTRKLSPEDKALWSKVAESLSPLHPDAGSQRRSASSEPPADDAPGAATLPAVPTRPVPRRRVAPEPKVRVTLAPDPMEAARQLPPQMDARAYGRLKRGKLSPESKIDLHGMTAERAHGELRGFIMDAHGRGLRLVLVITGKGRSAGEEPAHAPARRGVLRNAVPVWLAQPPLNTMVLQLTPAHQRHGGGGAYYVYLRRRR
ncbi:Smr/MutS family protein [Oceanibium sediminis]|uniref:Smr/MutS family protein n=1 Tax=Oceanibium sediminis TaxID=2026339 RepID=UPI000DD490DF|nr:Smr/MutS family protein [Oceanibium sediminis]